MTFIHVQFDEASKSFKILESEGDGSFIDGGIYLMGVGQPGLDDLDSQWIFQAGSKVAHA